MFLTYHESTMETIAIFQWFIRKNIVKTRYSCPVQEIIEKTKWITYKLFKYFQRILTIQSWPMPNKIFDWFIQKILEKTKLSRKRNESWTFKSKCLYVDTVSTIRDFEFNVSNLQKNSHYQISKTILWKNDQKSFNFNNCQAFLHKFTAQNPMSSDLCKWIILSHYSWFNEIMNFNKNITSTVFDCKWLKIRCNMKKHCVQQLSMYDNCFDAACWCTMMHESSWLIHCT